MKKVELQDAKPYAPPKHFNMTALKLHGKEETGTQQFWIGLSHFLPNGGAEMDASPTEKLYFVLMGLPLRWYMGDGSIVRMAALIDEKDVNPIPPRVYKYGVV